MKKNFNVLLLLCIVFSVSLNASEIEFDTKKVNMIEVAGLVVDAANLNALENAQLYDEKGLLIATTDAKGYFTGKINHSGDGPVHFKIRVKKKGYTTFVQTENWGNLGNVIRSTYYFGIIQKDSRAGNSFSEMTSNKDSSFDSVLSGFRAVKEKLDFKNKLEAAKSNNQKVFFEIGYEYYLINNGGWLKISSPEEPISTDGKRMVRASEINSLVKRSQIKGMTPVDSKEFSYEIYIR
ncbi:carboxypeptidase-like regulatory domain-containing protein [Chryseobacterium hagamense]|uniref:Carboxypeptidase regulatory-like domain-containing protein n=1 Tax=Chryseobacterium hagamense TaxID=395935 RepID=A0A511YKS0_9FLAO|nr:carboxypeptidase-like regulatory domain-containing protein [Chryseobacterium hagamense]GEN75799.1 hypothetical protein CHA01nite_15390 [Chryseobacterium hagamense]